MDCDKTGSVLVNVILRRVCVSIVALEEQQVFNFLSVNFVALIIQHSMRMRLLILPSVVCSALLYYFTLCPRLKRVK